MLLAIIDDRIGAYNGISTDSYLIGTQYFTAA